MMRRPFTTVTVVAMCGLLVVAVVGALGAVLVRRSDAGLASGSGARASIVTLSAATDDLTLAQVGFPAGKGRRLSARTLRIVALCAVRGRLHGGRSRWRARRRAARRARSCCSSTAPPLWTTRWTCACA